MTFPDPDTKSAALFDRAKNVQAGGSTRLSTYFAPYPVYASHGKGCLIYDVDGVERLDCVNNFMTLIHGHCRPEIVAALQQQLERGLSFSLPTERDIELAELLCERVPSFERARFVNSGTEAVMTAIKAARAYTDRPMIAKAEGAYHGSYDPIEVSHDATPDNWGDANLPARSAYTRGLPENVMKDVVVYPFPDLEASLALLSEHATQLAAIVVDPLPARIGFMRAPDHYFQALREFADTHGIVLVFDEVASFRVDYGGMQSRIGVEPDITTLGKIIGGGLPVGGLAGKAEFMSVFDGSGGKPLASHGGTFNANPMTMVAGHTALSLLTPSEFDRLQDLGDRARAGLSEAFKIAGVQGQVSGDGSLIKPHLHTRQLTDFRNFYAYPKEKQMQDALFHGFLRHGVLTGQSCLMALSTAMTEADIDRLCEAAVAALRDVRDQYGEAA